MCFISYLTYILERGRAPTPVFWPGEFHGLYSPWCLQELDTTEQLWLPLHIYIFIYIYTHTVYAFQVILYFTHYLHIHLFIPQVFIGYLSYIWWYKNVSCLKSYIISFDVYNFSEVSVSYIVPYLLRKKLLDVEIPKAGKPRAFVFWLWNSVFVFFFFLP